MTDRPTYLERTVEILVAHQRSGPSRCVCGPLRLGSSWADHVARILDDAGVLRTSKDDR